MSEQEESNTILERKNQAFYKDEEQNDLIQGNLKQQPVDKNTEVQMKGNNLMNKILILISVIVLFCLINYLFIHNKFYFKDTKKLQQAFQCSKKTYFYLSMCLSKCPHNFIADPKNNICLPSKMDQKQINITRLDQQTNFTQVEIFSKDFTQNILEDTFNDKLTGIIFFNDFINDDFTFLFQKIKVSKLQNFLSQINGAIITFSGANSLYLQNEEQINQQIKQLQDKFPQISSWYIVGFGFSGSFNGLKYFMYNLDMFKGIFIQDPIEDLGEIKELLENIKKQQKQTGTQQIQSISADIESHFIDLQQKQVFIFKNTFYKDIQTPVLDRLARKNLTQLSYFKNIQNDNDSAIKYFTDEVFSIIEQQINTQKKEIYNGIN
ncbi:transmembrane protein, putative (macronuclear) [Tetrahymena thermophila SB210]|uniref:Transmembrane protein, putative n=1 Tax=Tetrahymena thermophila (strain SB210) TaxID=312017 RepID=W7X6M7_TETTS|nr:transmembrane protein, putative [Tetrahymena thermophila SB210]EWS72028.1 transmembrane protein, putative [Tetrahymena thermophila SB210]|eukprot:XP_012655435.1 transmembrane protein, putative [Tetrahymena thermophila SB210]